MLRFEDLCFFALALTPHPHPLPPPAPPWVHPFAVIEMLMELNHSNHKVRALPVHHAAKGDSGDLLEEILGFALAVSRRLKMVLVNLHRTQSSWRQNSLALLIPCFYIALACIDFVALRLCENCNKSSTASVWRLLVLLPSFFFFFFFYDF